MCNIFQAHHWLQSIQITMPLKCACGRPFTHQSDLSKHIARCQVCKDKSRQMCKLWARPPIQHPGKLSEPERDEKWCWLNQLECHGSSSKWRQRTLGEDAQTAQSSLQQLPESEFIVQGLSDKSVMQGVVGDCRSGNEAQVWVGVGNETQLGSIIRLSESHFQVAMDQDIALSLGGGQTQSSPCHQV